MMRINKLVAALCMTCFVVPVWANENPLCQKKVAAIEKQLQFAKEAGNSHRVRGLERALANTKAHCTDAELIADQKEEIADQESDIAEILEEIKEKRAEGREDKVKKLERKLQREQEELRVLQNELNKMQ